MRDVYIVGIHTTKFGKYLDQGVKDLTATTVQGSLKDATVEKEALQSAHFSNCLWGQAEYQHCIRGQVALRPIGIDSIPITNVENACASASTAFHGAFKDIASGLYDVSLAVGAEKLYDTNKYSVFAGFLSATDVSSATADARRFSENMPEDDGAAEATGQPAPKKAKKKGKSIKDRMTEVRDMAAVGVQLGETLGYDQLREIVSITFGGGSKDKSGKKRGGDHSPFMDIYAYKAREHMQKYGSTQAQLAAIASKSHWHSSMNPNAQYTFEVSVEDVLNDRVIAPPLTRGMCAPIGDGAASAVLMSEDAVKRHGLSDRAIKVRASILGSGRDRGLDEPDIGERLSKVAYERAGLGPEDIDFVELHDATAFGEMHQTEALGFFDKGTGGLRAEAGDTRLGGKIPVNTSGGLVSRGHPIGASGLAQMHELVTQLRGEAGARQVEGARIGMAENGGGALGEEEAAMCIHIFEK